MNEMIGTLKQQARSHYRAGPFQVNEHPVASTKQMTSATNQIFVNIKLPRKKASSATVNSTSRVAKNIAQVTVNLRSDPPVCLTSLRHSLQANGRPTKTATATQIKTTDQMKSPGCLISTPFAASFLTSLLL
jgi:hypothetical protein